MQDDCNRSRCDAWRDTRIDFSDSGKMKRSSRENDLSRSTYFFFFFFWLGTIHRTDYLSTISDRYRMFHMVDSSKLFPLKAVECIVQNLVLEIVRTFCYLFYCYYSNYSYFFISFIYNSIRIHFDVT